MPLNRAARWQHDVIVYFLLVTPASSRTDSGCWPFLFLVVQDTPSAASSGQQPSALLHCLSQLNADTWAQVLLPKLVQQGSAAHVALACCQLRDLCFSSRHSLKLGALLDSSEPLSLGRQLQNLPEHFPNCTAVSLELKSYKGFNTMPWLLTELAWWVLCALEDHCL